MPYCYCDICLKSQVKDPTSETGYKPGSLISSGIYRNHQRAQKERDQLKAHILSAVVSEGTGGREALPVRPADLNQQPTPSTSTATDPIPGQPRRASSPVRVFRFCSPEIFSHWCFAEAIPCCPCSDEQGTGCISVGNRPPNQGLRQEYTHCIPFITSFYIRPSSTA